MSALSMDTEWGEHWHSLWCTVGRSVEPIMAANDYGQWILAPGGEKLFSSCLHHSWTMQNYTGIPGEMYLMTTSKINEFNLIPEMTKKDRKS
jgi:hypothetical protein